MRTSAAAAPWTGIRLRRSYNWELVFCELYAGGKYRNNEGGDYEYSLGLNGLGTCATQYSSEYMDVTVRRDGKKYTLHFEKGRHQRASSQEEPADRKKTGTDIRWRPDLEVFTDIDIPLELLYGDAEAPGRRERGRDLHACATR